MGTIVQDKYDKGCYYVDGLTWQVGVRYTLLKVLGCGSFSSVVSAIDNDTGEKVALKRIPDVLNNGENAKRVLREVCILRRLSHPHIIGLKDVFLRPSSTGRYVYKGGKLVPTSLDLYLALEYCDQGDLFHMRGQLSEGEVKVIMLQLLSAVQYLHANGVWHRDIKSANILMTYTNGARHIKLADLGSARSVLLEQRLRKAGGSPPHQRLGHCPLGSACAHEQPHHHHHHHHEEEEEEHERHERRQQLAPPGSGQLAGAAGADGSPDGRLALGGSTAAEVAAAAAAEAAAVQQVLVSHQATQTSGGGAAGPGGGSVCGGCGPASPLRPRPGSLEQQQQQLRSSLRRDSMDSISSDQQQQLAAGAEGAAQQQQQQPGGAKSVSFVQLGRSGSRLAPSGAPVHHSDSFLMDAAHSSPSEIYARPVAGGGGGFKSPLTRMVCTPCYRAPEVVMSRGGYTEAIDMWGCGCVFGELLQRVAWIGKATTPQLQVAPVFAIHGIPQTPTSGERFDGPGNSVTRSELAALFAVIGTPSWRCIESVTNPAWRRYLRKIPGRAPTLFRRFGSAGEVAVDLLARLLSFDPVRRCNSEEAIAHEYFEEMLKERHSSSAANLAALLNPALAEQELLLAAPDGGAGCRQGPSVADALEAELEVQHQQAHAAADEDMQDSLAAGGAQQHPHAANVLKRPREHSLSLQGGGRQPGGPAAAAAAAAAGSSSSHSGLDPAPSVGPFGAPAAAGAGAGAAGADGGEAMEEDELPRQQQAAAAALPPLPRPRSSGGGPAQQQQQQQQQQLGDQQASFRVTPSGQHYYELDDPAAALAALEGDMAALMSGGDDQDQDVAPGGPPPQAPQPLRELLEREVAEHSSHLEMRRHDLARVMAADGELVSSDSPPLSPLLIPAARSLQGGGAGRHAASGSIRNQWQHLQPDPGPSMDASRIGFQRLPHHADAEQTSLDPQQHLRAGRHGEWVADTLQVGARNSGGNVWGVSLVPQGFSEESHPELAAIIRHQHKR